MAGKESKAERNLSKEQMSNMSVRLDEETKELLHLVALSLKCSEKDVAIEAIQLYCADKLDAVNAKLSELKSKIAARARKK